MIIDFAAYRRNKAQPSWLTDAVQQELMCVNWDVTPLVTEHAVQPLASPPLPTDDEDLAAFHALAYSLATQV
ncbi:MAG TPA: hypothetical protein VNT02_09775 [Burkholderiales bacterium]|nr:hypothetical protein [Burkholderiales bacterium]